MTHERHELPARNEGTSEAASEGRGDPGKRASTGNVQRRTAAAPEPAGSWATALVAGAGVQLEDDPFGMHLADSAHVHAAAARGIDGPATSLPHADAIQRSFGAAHDVSAIKAHVGGPAEAATRDMGATAYATGDHVAFARQPDLHTAAHEAAHVVQQAQGVNLLGGVGDAGDVYERHADAVADRVVAGQSAEDLLSAGPGGGERAVQRKIARPTPVVQRDGGGHSGASSGTGTGTGNGAHAPPDPKAKVAKLHLYVDVDVKHINVQALKEGNVGHTWIALEYIDPHQVPDTVEHSHRDLLRTPGKYADPMGFWPDIENGIYYSPNPFKSWVQGWMRHPDRAHEGSEKATQTWELTQAEVDAVIAYAESKKGAQYSVFFFNCTHFGVEAVKAAGKSAPSATKAGIAMPNALYDGIKKRNKDGVGNTSVTDLDTGDTRTVEGQDSRKR